MKEFTILHLSDLHIDGNGRSFSKLLKSLLSDIKNQIISIPDGSLVIVVTGDIINMGCGDALSNAKKFFDKLKEVTEKKLKAIYIVPGNHDKYRTDSNNFLVPAYRKLISESNNNYFGDNFKKNIWPMHQETYHASGYMKLMEYIYDDLFDMPEIGHIAKNTYGVHTLTINSMNYCFILLNTAWSCIDNLDTRKLLLGKFQLNDISRQFHDLTDETKIDLTFVLGHHPIECLLGEEQDDLFSHMISYTEISANAYLCGHKHDRNVVNWSNSRHAIHTLMTGFGWPEKPSDRVHDHYYSIYTFNLDLNSMDIYVRKTNDGSEFIPDLSIYTGKNFQNNDKLVRPILLRESSNAITLSTANNIPSKNTYISTDFLQYSKLFLSKLNEIILETNILIESHKSDLYENIILPESLDGETKNQINSLMLDFMNGPESIEKLSDKHQDFMKHILKLNANIIYDNFQSFIQWLCQKLHQELIPSVDNGQIVRFHFRYLSDKSSGIYSTLCSSFSIHDEIDTNKNQPSDMKYGDLIEAAFLSSSTGCLIYSLNEKVCIHKIKDKWEDFITVVPKFEKNVYNKKVSKKSTKQYPLITFGVTINDHVHSIILHCMDFYSIDQYLSSMFLQYLNTFMIDVDAFLNWIKNEDRKAI